jgi:hypothetical protein
MKLQKTLPKMLNNKYVLYVVLFLAITNILGYLSIGDFHSLIFFVATGFLTTYFSKNMVVVLGTAMVATNFLYAGKKMKEGLMGWNLKEVPTGPFRTFREGFKGKDDDDEDEDEDEDEDDNKESLATLTPSAATESEEDSVDESVGKRVDYASTMEQAYNNLTSVLGKGGIESLSKETKGLLEQQKSLAGQLESMAPLLKDAKGLLKNMNLPNMQELEGLFNKFAPKKK